MAYLSLWQRCVGTARSAYVTCVNDLVMYTAITEVNELYLRLRQILMIAAAVCSPSVQ